MMTATGAVGNYATAEDKWRGEGRGMLLDSAPLHILLSVSCCNCVSVLFTLRAYVNKANSDCDSEAVRRTQRMFTDVEKKDMHRGEG